MHRLLIADDDVDLCEFLENELSQAGFIVTTIRNGADPIVSTAEHPFDLIILDMFMPGLDGIQAIRVLRKISPDVPIIGLTGYVGHGYMSQATDYGGCLNKPVIMSELINEINETLTTIE